MKRFLRRLKWLFSSQKPIPSGPKDPKITPVERPLIITFYTPTKIYFSNCDPTTHPRPEDRCIRWINAVTTELFEYVDGTWIKQDAKPGRVVKIEDSRIGEYCVTGDPAAALDQYIEALGILCSSCGKEIVAHKKPYMIPSLDWNQGSDDLRPVCAMCYARHNSLMKLAESENKKNKVC